MSKVVNFGDLGKGIFPDAGQGDLAPGLWTACANMRFFNGYASKFEGAAQITNGGSTTVQYRFVMPYATPVSSGSSMTTKYMLGAGIARAFSNNGTAESEITRYTEGVVITSITRVGTTATVTTATNHGRTTADLFSTWGNVPAVYNVEGVAITVTSPTTFTYTIASDPGTNATTVGLYSYNGATSNFTGTASDTWTGGNLGGIAYLNNPVNGLYYWNGTGRLKKVPGANVAFASRTFKAFVIQIGPTVSGTPQPWNVAWSDITEPGELASSFTAASTNSAGEQPLADTPGAAIDGAPLGDIFALYKQDSIYTLQYIGGNEVFNIQRIPGGDGIFGRNCVVDTPVGHVFLSQKRDIRIFDGRQTRSIADGRVKNWIASLMNKSRDYCAFVCSNPAKTEVWICFNQTGHSTDEGATVAYVWNWEHDTWGQFQFAGYSTTYPTHATNGTWPSAMSSLLAGEDLLLATQDSKVGVNVIGGADTWFGNTVGAYLYRADLKLTQDYSACSMQRSRWHFVEQGQTVTVYHGSSLKYGAPPTFPGSFVSSSYVVGTNEWANARSKSGKWQSIWLVLTGTVQSLRSGAIEFTVDGER